MAPILVTSGDARELELNGDDYCQGPILLDNCCR